MNKIKNIFKKMSEPFKGIFTNKIMFSLFIPFAAYLYIFNFVLSFIVEIMKSNINSPEFIRENLGIILVYYVFQALLGVSMSIICIEYSYKHILKIIPKRWMMDEKSKKVIKKLNESIDQGSLTVKHFQKDSTILSFPKFSIIFPIDKGNFIGIESFYSWHGENPHNIKVSMFDKETNQVFDLTKDFKNQESFLFEVYRSISSIAENTFLINALNILKVEGQTPNAILKEIFLYLQNEKITILDNDNISLDVKKDDITINITKSKKSFNITIKNLKNSVQFSSDDLDDTFFKKINRDSFFKLQEKIHNSIKKRKKESTGILNEEDFSVMFEPKKGAKNLTQNS